MKTPAIALTLVLATTPLLAQAARAGEDAWTAEVLRTADRDGDGVTTRAEAAMATFDFLAGARTRGEEAWARMARLFGVAPSAGTIPAKAVARGLERILADADANRDGDVSADEISAMYARLDPYLLRHVSGTVSMAAGKALADFEETGALARDDLLRMARIADDDLAATRDDFLASCLDEDAGRAARAVAAWTERQTQGRAALTAR